MTTIRAVLAVLLAVATGSPSVHSQAAPAAVRPSSAAGPANTIPAHPPRTADPSKVLRIAFQVAETGFDPVRVHDLYSNIVNEAIFERLVTYDYLARPAKLVPQAAESLPEITDDGRTYTFRIRKGIQFHTDPAFGGKPRELVAEDFAYTLKRFMDPRNRSVWKFLLDGKIAGLDEEHERAKRNGDRFDYDAKVPGLEVVDRYTLRIRLTRTDFNFATILAMSTFGAVAREVIEAHPGDENAHPIGTGPYRLKQWARSSRIVLEAHPEYRGFIWDFAPGDDALDREIVAAMKGKRMPTIGIVEIKVIEEEQSRWLAFQRDELDLLNVPETFAPVAIPGSRVNAELASRGVRLNRSIDPDITYAYFNIRDPVVGGMSKEQIALRRAITMGYDLDDEIRVIRKGQAVEAHYIIPPGIVGHDPAYRKTDRYDPQLANALLDRMGFRRGRDGYRTFPDGRPLTLVHSTQTSAIYRELDELWKRSMDRIGIRIEIRREQFSELIKAEKRCLVQHRIASWIADYPDGDNFMQLLYGRNIGESNNACFQHPQWDELYERTRVLPAGPERDRLYRELNRLAGYLGVWTMGVSRYRNMLIQPRVIGYRKHPILYAEWIYHDMETESGK